IRDFHVTGVQTCALPILGRVDALPDNARIMHWFEIAKPTVKPYGPPDRRFAYNNTNYVVLASIIEKITGLSYGGYLKMAIFDPLGMIDTLAITDSYVSLTLHMTTGITHVTTVLLDHIAIVYTVFRII